jgi:glycosyltransferase involved in cell wall biosynthesis
MRVAFVHPAAPGEEGTGAVQTATLLVRGLVERGHEVTVLCRRGPDGSPDVDVEFLDTSGFPYHTATLVNRALERRADDGTLDDYDIVHSYLPTTIPGMAEIGTETPVGTVVSLNAFGGVCPKNDLRYMARETCRDRGIVRCAACSIATSPGSEHHSAVYRSASRVGNLRLIEAGMRRLDAVDAFHPIADHVRDTYAVFGFPEDRMTVVPTPVDERFVIDHQSSFESPYRLLYVGYLKEHKGVDRLLPILDQVRAAGIDARLTIVGDGGRRGRLEQQAAEHGLEAATRFTGHVPNAELPEVYTSHDLFLYPGLWEEPRGRVFMEALAAGTPVVSTDVGVVERLVGGAGLVTTSSVDSLAEGVVTTLTDRNLPAMSTTGQERMEQYRLPAVTAQLESLYAEVLGA